MTDEQRRPRPAAQYGPTSATVAANVRRVRERRGLTIYGLSDKLERAGRPIAPSAIAKIERQQRQVTVDDLMALAATLGVAPSALLLPLDDSPKSSVEITGAGTVPADVAWDWADGQRPLRVSGHDPHAVWLEAELYGRPPGRRARMAHAEADMRELEKRQRELGLAPHEWPPGMIQPPGGE
ncbi:helix-turn-helix domain-containing protein [Streptomyces sp. NBC_01262]|uniref:helix-turn-helix domain-containing protein n=1 Tax=Streptomyces sp. NBC_01262 TaxID=2903803 RepID=UPI002E3527F9|nr:helix-turn-helix transcriptional regulator [Streptomyces sp. NBC_01262]